MRRFDQFATLLLHSARAALPALLANVDLPRWFYVAWSVSRICPLRKTASDRVDDAAHAIPVVERLRYSWMGGAAGRGFAGSRCPDGGLVKTDGDRRSSRTPTAVDIPASFLPVRGSVFCSTACGGGPGRSASSLLRLLRRQPSVSGVRLAPAPCSMRGPS